MDSPIPPVAATQPLPPVLPPAEKNQNWLKILLAGIGVLIVLGLFANFYLLIRNQKPTAEIVPTPTQAVATPTVNPTANWKTYTNKIARYEFRYPNEAIIEEKGDFEPSTCLKITIRQASLSIKSPGGNYGGCVVTGPDYEPTTKVISEKFMLLGKEEAASGLDMQSEGIGAKPTERAEFLTIKDVGNIKEFIIEYRGIYDETDTGSTYQNDKERVRQILSTFKFLDQNQTDPTVSWKTYINDFAKFSLRYPSDMTINEKSFTTKSKQVILKGKEGDLTINMTTKDEAPGWGGGCDPQYQKTFVFAGESIKVCESEQWLNQLYFHHPDGTRDFQISATFNSPYGQNKEEILQILSTFKFLP